MCTSLHTVNMGSTLPAFGVPGRAIRCHPQPSVGTTSPLVGAQILHRGGKAEDTRRDLGIRHLARTLLLLLSCPDIC